MQHRYALVYPKHLVRLYPSFRCLLVVNFYFSTPHLYFTGPYYAGQSGRGILPRTALKNGLSLT